jgi:hypothetical protein
MRQASEQRSGKNNNPYNGRLTMKKIVAGLCALFFVVSVAGVSVAAKLKCTVDGVKGDKVTMTCEKADKLKEGDKLKISPPKKGAAVEGC